MTRRFLFFLLAFLILTCTAYAAPLQPGFKTLGIWDPAKNVRLDFAVWYPSRSAPFQVNYGDWNFSAARGRPPVEGKHPLILLSHDSAGSRFSLHELASELARNGFVVLAFTHPGDNVDDMGALFMPVQVTDRAKQLTQALDIALADPETAPLIDPDRIGVLGVGPGGTAAMLIAGARLDATGWPSTAPERKKTPIHTARRGHGSAWGLFPPLPTFPHPTATGVSAPQPPFPLPMP